MYVESGNVRAIGNKMLFGSLGFRLFMNEIRK